MGFKKFLGKVAEKIEEKAEDIKEAREEKRQRQEMERGERLAYENKINDLLDKFEIPDMDKFLKRYLNELPEGEEIVDEDTGRSRIKPAGRKEYLDFFWEHLDDGDINYNHLKDFALKNRITSPSFFGDKRDEEYEKSDFESIVNSVKVGFEPEKIRNEEHLEAQLTIFLKAKFPDRKIQRQLTTKNNDILDIVVDDKYVFELKVPTSRSHLRNLSAQIEEYIEQYPNLCVVIADTSGVQDQNGEPVEANLTQHIKEYADKYKVKYSVETLVYDIVTRK